MDLIFIIKSNSSQSTICCWPLYLSYCIILLFAHRSKLSLLINSQSYCDDDAEWSGGIWIPSLPWQPCLHWICECVPFPDICLAVVFAILASEYTARAGLLSKIRTNDTFEETINMFGMLWPCVFTKWSHVIWLTRCRGRLLAGIANEVPQKHIWYVCQPA